MTLRQSLLTMSAVAALAAGPALAQSGSSMQSTTTQTTPQQGQVSSTPGAHAQSTQAQGSTGSRDASGGVMAQSNTSTPRDGAPGNPPSTATQRAADSVTGNRTPPDGTPGNPPGTAAGRAMDRTLGTNTTGANPSHSSAVNPSGANTTATAPHASTTAAGASSAAMAVDSAALRNGRRASKIIGANIYNENNESIGEVEDILIPMPAAAGGATAPAPVAIISVGGFLGIGAKLVAVPYDRLQMNTERNRWTMSGATKESLTQLPTYTYEGTAAERRG